MKFDRCWNGNEGDRIKSWDEPVVLEEFFSSKR